MHVNHCDRHTRILGQRAHVPLLCLYASNKANADTKPFITYGTARFKLYKHTRVPYTRHYTSQKIFVACLPALGKVMTSPPLVASKHTCYKLVTSFSTRTRNVNALDTCHTRNQLERVFVCIYTCIYLITRWECYSRSQNRNNTCSDAISLFSGKEQNHGSRA